MRYPRGKINLPEIQSEIRGNVVNDASHRELAAKERRGFPVIPSKDLAISPGAISVNGGCLVLRERPGLNGLGGGIVLFCWIYFLKSRNDDYRNAERGLTASSVIITGCVFNYNFLALVLLLVFLLSLLHFFFLAFFSLLL